jgi:hypothetical protein
MKHWMGEFSRSRLKRLQKRCNSFRCCSMREGRDCDPILEEDGDELPRSAALPAKEGCR